MSAESSSHSPAADQVRSGNRTVAPGRHRHHDTTQPPARPGVLAATVWAVLAYYGVQVTLGLVLGYTGLTSLTSNLELFVVQGVAQLLTILAVVKILQHYRLSLTDLGLAAGQPFKRFGLVVMTFAAYLVLSGIFTSIVGGLLQINFDQQQNLGFTSPTGPELVLVFITLVIITPIVEELLFRGFLFRAYRRRFGFVLGSILVSMLFGLVHGQWNVGLDVFVLSMAACYLRETTGSLWPAIMLHALKNSLAFLILFGLKL